MIYISEVFPIVGQCGRSYRYSYSCRGSVDSPLEETTLALPALGCLRAVSGRVWHDFVEGDPAVENCHSSQEPRWKLTEDCICF